MEANKMTEITVAIITSASSLIVAVISIITNNRILGYKVDELKKQVEKHNQVVEKVALLQQDNATQWKRLDELQKYIEELKKEVK